MLVSQSGDPEQPLLGLRTCRGLHVFAHSRYDFSEGLYDYASFCVSKVTCKPIQGSQKVQRTKYILGP